MIFEEEILFPPFQEDGEEGEPDPLEGDDLGDDGNDNPEEPKTDGDGDDDLGIEEETE